MEVKKLMIFKSRNLVNFILNFFKLYCCYRLKVSAYIVRVQSGIALLIETRVLITHFALEKILSTPLIGHTAFLLCVPSPENGVFQKILTWAFTE